MTRHQIAAVFVQIAEWLAFRGDRSFRRRVYVQAAQVLEAAKAFETLVAEGRLTSLPGIGDALARQILEMHETGRSGFLERLREGLPEGLIDLQRVGLSRVKILALHQELGVENLEGLKEALTHQRVRSVHGFGPKTEARLARKLEELTTHVPRLTRNRAEAVIASLRLYLDDAAEVEAAGELRRGLETVGRIEVVITGLDQAALRLAIQTWPKLVSAEPDPTEPEALLGHLGEGIPLRVFVTDAAHHAATLVRATGPEEHVRAIEAACTGKGTATEAPDERSLYALAGISFVPPELRDDPSRLLSGREVPALIEAEDIRGMIHCHTNFSDGSNTIEEMARAAEARGFQYLTITDHSPTAHYAGGLSEDRLKEQWEEIARVQELVKIRLLRGTESDITREGELDYPDHILEQLDVIIASIHARHKQDSRTMTERIVRALRHPLFKIWGHALGRILLQREPIECDIEAILDAASESSAAIEINGDPYRLDLPPAYLPLAKARKIRFVVSTDAHSIDNLGNLRHGVAIARRGGLEKTDVLNTLPAEAFLAAVRPTGSGIGQDSAR